MDHHRNRPSPRAYDVTPPGVFIHSFIFTHFRKKKLPPIYISIAGPNPSATSTSPSAASPPDASSWKSAATSYRRLRRTFALCAPVRESYSVVVNFYNPRFPPSPPSIVFFAVGEAGGGGWRGHRPPSSPSSGPPPPHIGVIFRRIWGGGRDDFASSLVCTPVYAFHNFSAHTHTTPPAHNVTSAHVLPRLHAT